MASSSTDDDYKESTTEVPTEAATNDTFVSVAVTQPFTATPTDDTTFNNTSIVPDPGDGDGGLEIGVIAGIAAAGGVLLILLLVLIIYCCCCRRRDGDARPMKKWSERFRPKGPKFRFSTKKTTEDVPLEGGVENGQDNPASDLKVEKPLPTVLEPPTHKDFKRLAAAGSASPRVQRNKYESTQPGELPKTLPHEAQQPSETGNGAVPFHDPLYQNVPDLKNVVNDPAVPPQEGESFDAIYANYESDNPPAQAPVEEEEQPMYGNFDVQAEVQEPAPDDLPTMEAPLPPKNISQSVLNLHPEAKAQAITSHSMEHLDHLNAEVPPPTAEGHTFKKDYYNVRPNPAPGGYVNQKPPNSSATEDDEQEEYEYVDKPLSVKPQPQPEVTSDELYADMQGPNNNHQDPIYINLKP